MLGGLSSGKNFRYFSGKHLRVSSGKNFWFYSSKHLRVSSGKNFWFYSSKHLRVSSGKNYRLFSGKTQLNFGVSLGKTKLKCSFLQVKKQIKPQAFFKKNLISFR
jgi:hypothetical protein